jgi:hypothetical protein
MNEDLVVLDTIPVQVSLESVLAQLGYPEGACLSPSLQEKVKIQMTETLQLIEPKGAYIRLEGEQQKGFELFSGVEGIALALATIGPAVERRAGQLIRTDQGAAALIVDAIGTVAAEQAADFVERRIRQDFTNSGWTISRRYAPGYCGWKMEAQREIFSHFPDTLGIKLTTSCLMVPEKSLSFACLLSRSSDFSMIRVAHCRLCRQKACPYRSEPYEAQS